MIQLINVSDLTEPETKHTIAQKTAQQQQQQIHNYIQIFYVEHTQVAATIVDQLIQAETTGQLMQDDVCSKGGWTSEQSWNSLGSRTGLREKIVQRFPSATFHLLRPALILVPENRLALCFFFVEMIVGRGLCCTMIQWWVSCNGKY